MSRATWTDEKLFDRLLNNRSDKTYWDTINEIRKRSNSYVFKRAIELTKSNNPQLRKRGVDILAQLGITPRPFYKESIESFFKLLETEKDNDVLFSVLYAIGHNNEKLNSSQVEKIASYRHTTENIIKDGLVFALLGIDKPIAISTLIQLSEDKSANIRNWATFGIGTQIDTDTPAIREALWERINDKNEDTKDEAIAGLAKRKDERVISIIQNELEHQDYSGLLFEAITELGDKQFLPVLKEHYEKNKTNPDINPDWLNNLENCITELTEK